MSEMPEVELKLLDARLEGWGFPHWGSALAAGLDLHACVAETKLIEAQAPAILIPAGFALSIGDGDWAALVYPRSGMGHKRGLVLGNGVGVVDADYQGELFVSAWNRNPPGSAPIEIAPGERIAQLVFTRVARPRLRRVTSFTESSVRGAGGYGSTGSGPANAGVSTGAVYKTKE